MTDQMGLPPDKALAYEVQKIIVDRARIRWSGTFDVRVALSPAVSGAHQIADTLIVMVEQEYLRKEHFVEYINGTRVVEFEYPDGWVQALRQRLGFSHRRKSVKQEFTYVTRVNRVNVCPHLNMSHQGPHIAFMTKKPIDQVRPTIQGDHYE